MPRKPKGREIANIYSFSLPGENRPLMRKFDELCFRESKGRGDLLLPLITGYVNKHWPGNPQTLDTMYFPEEHPMHRSKPPTLEIKLLAREIDDLLETLDKDKIKGRKFKREEDEKAFKSRTVKELSKKATRLERLNEIIEEEQYRKLLERCSEVLSENKAI